MSKNILVISVDIRETRVALIEGGIIAELHIERRNRTSSGSVGNVVLGKVTRVLPGLQAAFIDIGQERAAFLHVEDLIRPDDFDAYLAGGKSKPREEAVATGNEELDAEAEADLDAGVPPAGTDDVQSIGNADDVATIAESAGAIATAAVVGAIGADDEEIAWSEPSVQVDEPAPESVVFADPESVDDVELAADAAASDAARDSARDVDADIPLDDDSSDDLADDAEGVVDAIETDGVDTADAEPDVDGADVDSADEARGEEAIAEGATRGGASAAAADPAAAASPGAAAKGPAKGSRRRRGGARPAEDLDFPGLPGFTVTDPNEPAPKAATPRAAREGDRRRGRSRSGRRGGRGHEPREAERGGRERSGSRERGARTGGERGERGGRGAVPNRISKTTPIRDVVREGQEIIVQVTKEPIGTKGARCSSHISLPGRYVVYLPTVDHIGISKRIGSDKERSRLREAIESMKPPSGGLIVRTVAEGLTKKQLKQDVGYLVRLWGEIAKKKEGARAPTLLMSELDLVLKTARDLFTDEVDQIVIDDRHQYERLCRFVEMFAPERLKDIVYYDDDEPIFDAYGIEDEIARALSRKVPLPSGGHLIIDQAEALTAIDVNTGRFVGKGSKDMEETILKTNIEAVHEIAYQLRFRNIGGLIILDLIDMEKHGNREKVRRELEQVLQKDKAKTTLNRISDLGLIEMTRKRTRESLGRLLHEPCFYCDGTGQLQSKETIAYEILREMRRKRADLPGYTIVVNAHPAVADLLIGPEKAAVADAENKFMRKITVQPRKEYHLEQFDLQGK